MIEINTKLTKSEYELLRASLNSLLKKFYAHTDGTYITILDLANKLNIKTNYDRNVLPKNRVKYIRGK